MQLRGLEERVGQSTRELELSLVGERSTQSSPGSSRRSTPNLLTAGGSFEDMMGTAGLEVEEVARLEARVRSLEKAEAGAVDRVRKLDEERKELKGLLQSQEEKGRESVLRMEEQDILVTKLQAEMGKMKARLALQEEERKQLELLAERGEEIEAERELLQQRVVEQQVQVSSLQAALQAGRLRTGSTGEEKWMEERSSLRAEVEALKSELRRAEREGETGRQQAGLLQTRLIQLEEELQEQANGNSGQLPCQQCASYARDVAELRSVQEKLQVGTEILKVVVERYFGLINVEDTKV